MEGFKVKDEPMDALAIDSQVMVNFLYETAAGIRRTAGAVQCLT